MNESNKFFVEYELRHLLFTIFTDAIKRENVFNELFEDVVSDIEETADENFNSENVRIALVRVLFKKIGIDN